MATITELLADLDPSPQGRGRQFERICKWYLRHDPIYKAQLEKVWLWDEWPEREGRDLGIDLVARTKDGKLWAIQAKAYDPEKTLRKSDVDSFLANSAQKTFAFRLILTTCKDLTGNLRKQFTQVEPPVSAKVLSDLESANLNWPESPEALRAPNPERKSPREHQAEAIQAVLRGFMKHDRGRLIMACGTGKTLVGLWVAEKLKAERTLVLLPSLSLLGQTMGDWLANGRRKTEVLAVCSDKTVRGDTDAWVSDTSELGIPVTTDPEEIAAFLDRPGPRCVFSTYQSSPQIAEAQKLTDQTFDLAVADEAHRCAGRVSGAFATILKAEEIRADRRLFMTATPRYFTGRVKKVAGLYDHELASMDDKESFGLEFHTLTFGEAIERDLLSPYQVVIIGVDDPTYKEIAEHGEFVARDGDEVMDARTLATHIALAKAMKKYDLRRMITFHSRIDKARNFAKQFPQVVEWMPRGEGPDGDLWCAHVSGKMLTNQRKARLDRLREVDGGGRGLLANARCLGEGVDVPTLDGVVFVDRRRSQVDIVQNVGRAIRKADEKTVGTIVLPVFIDSSEDAETAVEGSEFKPVWDVLRALRDHDDDLGEWIDELRKIRDWKGEPREWPGNIFFDVDLRFAESIRTHALDHIAARPKLTEEKILELADAHFSRTGEWPSTSAGPVHGVPEEHWKFTIDAALRSGTRGLPGRSSLARLLATEREVRNPKDLSDLTVELVLGWADQYRDEHGVWPNASAGEISDSGGETWSGVNSSLLAGRRGLPGGRTISRLLRDHRGVRHRLEQESLSEEQILRWADLHQSRRGSWPNRKSGEIDGSGGETWAGIDVSLRYANRGLTERSSLADLLAKKRAVRSRKSRPPLSIEQILEWADAHRQETGAWPTRSDGPVRGHANETWGAINLALHRGYRGLEGRMTLPRLLRDKRDVPMRRKDKPREPSGGTLTIVQIVQWAEEHHARTGRWPKYSDGPVLSQRSETWRHIDYALRWGRRGLPGGTTLAGLLSVQTGVRAHLHQPPLTAGRILSWADAYYEQNGYWPNVTSGEIEGVDGEKWSMVCRALREGGRGLPGGSSLAKLLDEHRRKKEENS